MFDYLLIDELQEHKSDTSGRSMACGKLISSVKHVLGLTGTIIGGYANHLYPLLMRITPATLLDEGFEWGKDMAFSEAYGRIDRIITTKEEGFDTHVLGQVVQPMRRATSGSRTERKSVRPGVMPTMFGRHMIGVQCSSRWSHTGPASCPTCSSTSAGHPSPGAAALRCHREGHRDPRA